LRRYDLVDGVDFGTRGGVPPRVLELLSDTLECLVIFRNFDDRRSVLRNRSLAGRAEIGLARLISLPTCDATLLAKPFMVLAAILPRSSARILVYRHSAAWR